MTTTISGFVVGILIICPMLLKACMEFKLGVVDMAQEAIKKDTNPLLFKLTAFTKIFMYTAILLICIIKYLNS